MKYRIEKNTVQETLVIPLYGRKICTKLYPNLYKDEEAIKIIAQIDYDFSLLEKQTKKLMYRFGYLEVAARQNDLSIEIKDYLKTHPNASVVNLGCGLDNMGRKCDNGTCKLYNLDFEDVIKVRNQLIPTKEREENIACDLNNTEWFNKIESKDGVVFFASGVFYYFLQDQVKELITKMSNAFPGGKIVFDCANKKAGKLLLKTWLKVAKIKDVGAYFAISNAKKEISPWSENLIVSSKGYMLGYNDLKDHSISKLFRFIAKCGDKFMEMKIVRIDFKSKE